MDAWTGFAGAQAAASAALAGLVLVGASVNLERILANPSSIGRAAEALLVLLNLLILSSLIMVPGQSLALLGIEMIVLSAATLILITTFQRSARTQIPVRLMVIRVTLGLVAIVPWLVAGFLLVNGNETGLYWIVPGVVGSFVVAFLNAWVLLIEIDR